MTFVVERCAGGRGWAEVHRGETVDVVPMDDAYAAWRVAERSAAPSRMWVSDWDDGRFPTVDAWPARAALGLLATGVASRFDPLVGLAGGALAALWFSVRRTRIWCDEAGVAVGAPWRRRVWPTACGWEPAGPGVVRVWAWGGTSGGEAPLPAVLLPAFRGRVQRLYGVEVAAGPPTPRARAAIAASHCADATAALSIAVVGVAFGLAAPKVPVLIGVALLGSAFAGWFGLGLAAVGVRWAPVVVASSVASAALTLGTTALWAW